MKRRALPCLALLFAAALLALLAGCPSTSPCTTGGDCTCTGSLCDFDCAAGGCNQQCEGGRCEFNCKGGGCNQQCQPDTTCNVGCAGGGCTQQCSVGATCTLTCSGGGCTQQCIGTTCSKSCPSNNCL